VYDFISKRFDEAGITKSKKPQLIFEAFNVSTAFAGSVAYLGWVGFTMMLFFMLLFPVLFIFIIGTNSRYKIISVSILCSIYFYSFFDNMFIFSGLAPQLLFPLFLSFIEKK
jgi:hypothetical protein